MGREYNPERLAIGGIMSEFGLFSLSEEHKMIREAARDFAQNEIVPIAAAFDES
jgi:alkylation response protein AidB-like acyl-CoA dehydrogenase